MFKKILKNFDYLLLLIVLVILGIGLFTIASATGYDLYGMTRALKLQVVGGIIGIVLMTMLLFIDYKYYGYIYLLIYALSIILLLILYIPGVGVIRGGARSWINLGFIDLQTSELSKIGYIIFLSKFIDRRRGINSLVEALFAGATALPIFFLLIKQPDLGSALVFLFITFGIIFVSGIKYWHMLFLGSIAGVTIPIFYSKLKDYQKERLFAYLNQDDLSLKENYHVHMSKISIGSGGLYGKGYLAGAFHKLNYLPVKESDFIFAVFVEEWGYYGGFLLISLFTALLVRLLYIAFITSEDRFSSNIVIGILFMFGFQIFENIGMTMGIMPVTGLTLPFFSAGPTSLVSSFVAIGLVQSCFIHREKKDITADYSSTATSEVSWVSSISSSSKP